MIAPLLAQGGPVIPHFGQADKCVRTNGTFCLHWFLDNFGNRFWPRVVEHIQLTLIAVGIGFVLAFVLALVAFRYPRWEMPVANVTALVYTIPSIALFQVLVPVTGINRLTIEIEGRGGHAARPHMTIDPVLVGAQIVNQIQSIVARNVDPLQAAVISICMFQAGSTDNVIPQTALLRGTARSLTPAVQDILVNGQVVNSGVVAQQIT